MASTVKNLIKYTGIAQHLPQKITTFKQLSLQEHLSLPEEKPSIEQILHVTAHVEIIKSSVIKTPVVTSLEGQKLTGWKLLIEGELKQKIEYAAEDSLHTVHAAHFIMPFVTFIVLPPNFVPNTCVTIKSYIEDIFVEQVNPRTIFKNVLLLINALICSS